MRGLVDRWQSIPECRGLAYPRAHPDLHTPQSSAAGCAGRERRGHCAQHGKPTFAGNIAPRKPSCSATVQCECPAADRGADPRQPQSHGPIVAMRGQTRRRLGYTDRPVSRPYVHFTQLLPLSVKVVVEPGGFLRTLRKYTVAGIDGRMAECGHRIKINDDFSQRIRRLRSRTSGAIGQ